MCNDTQIVIVPVHVQGATGTYDQPIRFGVLSSVSFTYTADVFFNNSDTISQQYTNRVSNTVYSNIVVPNNLNNPNSIRIRIRYNNGECIQTSDWLVLNSQNTFTNNCTINTGSATVQAPTCGTLGSVTIPILTNPPQSGGPFQYRFTLWNGGNETTSNWAPLVNGVNMVANNIPANSYIRFFARNTLGCIDPINDGFIGAGLPCPTPTPTPTSTVTPTVTPTITVTPTNTVTPTVTPTVTSTVTPTRTPTKTPTNTPSISVSPTATPTVTPTITPTRTPTKTPSPTPTNTVTPTRTPTRTPSNTPSITPTITPTSSLTPTNTSTPTSTVTPTASIAPTVTPTNTPSASVQVIYTPGECTNGIDLVFVIDMALINGLYLYQIQQQISGIVAAIKAASGNNLNISLVLYDSYNTSTVLPTNHYTNNSLYTNLPANQKIDIEYNGSRLLITTLQLLSNDDAGFIALFNLIGSSILLSGGGPNFMFKALNEVATNNFAGNFRVNTKKFVIPISRRDTAVDNVVNTAKSSITNKFINTTLASGLPITKNVWSSQFPDKDIEDKNPLAIQEYIVDEMCPIHVTPTPTPTTPPTPVVPCGGEYSFEGQRSYPYNFEVDFNGVGNTSIVFDSFNIPDRLVIRTGPNNTGAVVLDTGYIGDAYEDYLQGGPWYTSWSLIDGLIDPITGSTYNGQATWPIPTQGLLNYNISVTQTKLYASVYAPLSGTAFYFKANCVEVPVTPTPTPTITPTNTPTRTATPTITPTPTSTPNCQTPCENIALELVDSGVDINNRFFVRFLPTCCSITPISFIVTTIRTRGLSTRTHVFNSLTDTAVPTPCSTSSYLVYYDQNHQPGDTYSYTIELFCESNTDVITGVFSGVTPTPTPTRTVTPTVTPTVTITPSPTRTPTRTPTVTPTNTVTPTRTPTATPSQTVCPAPGTLYMADQCDGCNRVNVVYGANCSLTTEIVEANDVVNCCPPNPSPTPTSTTTVTPTNTPTRTPTRTPTATPSVTSSNTPEPTPSNTPTRTPTVTPTATVTPTNTPSNTPAPSVTPTATVTPTPSLSLGAPIPSNTPTPTVTPTGTPTRTPDPTPTRTPTNTPSITPTSTPTRTPDPTPTRTPTRTPDPTPSNTATPTVTPSSTLTPTPTPSVTSCVCAPPRVCQDYNCECPGGLAFCNPQCVNLQVDPNNCGQCGTVCPSGQCINGQCVGVTPTPTPTPTVTPTKTPCLEYGNIITSNCVGNCLRYLLIHDGNCGTTTIQYIDNNCCPTPTPTSTPTQTPTSTPQPTPSNTPPGTPTPSLPPVVFYCGSIPYNPTTHGCCSADNPYNLSTEDCCGNLAYNTSTSYCCSGIVICDTGVPCSYNSFTGLYECALI